METGSIVETVGDFEEVRRQWRLQYPKRGDVLTVSAVTPHPDAECRRKGIVLLYFEEIPGLTGISDKKIDGTPNFVELRLPDEIMELLQEPMKQKDFCHV
mgnify:CR=1 FL=1